MNVGEYGTVACVLFYNKYHLWAGWEGLSVWTSAQELRACFFPTFLHPSLVVNLLPFTQTSSSFSHLLLIPVWVTGSSILLLLKHSSYLQRILLHILHANVRANANPACWMCPLSWRDSICFVLHLSKAFLTSFFPQLQLLRFTSCPTQTVYFTTACGAYLSTRSATSQQNDSLAALGSLGAVLRKQTFLGIPQREIPQAALIRANCLYEK